jgi:uncharacterized protein
MSEKRSRRASHALQFNVAQLLKQPTGSRRVYDIDTGDVPALNDELRLSAPLRGRVQFVRIGHGILVTGKLESAVELECTRCLSECVEETEFEIEEEFHPTHDVESGAQLAQEPDQDQATLIDEQHILDLGEVVRQNLVLSLPPSPVCRADCQGLCPVCGQNWNEKGCDCETEVSDPRWEGLKASFEE